MTATNNTRRVSCGAAPGMRSPGEARPGNDNRRQRLLLLAMAAVVAPVVTAVHWPVLSCKAIGFDDEEYLHSAIVTEPGWTSTMRAFREVLAPSTVRGYYQPLAMIS